MWSREGSTISAAPAPLTFKKGGRNGSCVWKGRGKQGRKRVKGHHVFGGGNGHGSLAKQQIEADTPSVQRILSKLDILRSKYFMHFHLSTFHTFCKKIRKEGGEMGKKM